uniref:Uncharacterized protein n=1 Tax=Myotis myotis TaxID=51298 RepID=A0A7J7SC58_MYOMY|nr:hypothetical protein mMyoMyo1_009473 [Myotis myotis]
MILCISVGSFVTSPLLFLILFFLVSLFVFFVFFLKIYFIDSLQRGRKRDRKLETLMREKHRSAASCTPPTGDVHASKAHAPDRNRTWDPRIHRPTLYPLSQTSQGSLCFLMSLARGSSILFIFSKNQLLV